MEYSILGFKIYFCMLLKCEFLRKFWFLQINFGKENLDRKLIYLVSNYFYFFIIIYKQILERKS